MSSLTQLQQIDVDASALGRKAEAGLARPLDKFPVIRTRRAEELQHALGRIYAEPTLELAGRAGTFDSILNNCKLEQIGLAYGGYSQATRWRYPHTNFFVQLFPIKGSGEIIVGKSHAALMPNSGVPISSNVSYQLNCGQGPDADYEHLVLRMTSDALTKKLAAITGVAVGAALRVDLTQDCARPAAQSLRDLFLFLVGEVSASAAHRSALMIAELEQAVIVAFLCGNQHNYSHLLDQRAPGVAPWQVRRAEAYIEANWNQPISMEAIAAATGASARSIFRAFKQSRGCSPMAFAKQVRLRHARRLLSSADAAVTITDVAFECGFGNLSRFSKVYRRAFGELPSQVMRRANGASGEKHTLASS